MACVSIFAFICACMQCSKWLKCHIAQRVLQVVIAVGKPEMGRVAVVPMITNARLFIILFVRNFRRVCSRFWLECSQFCLRSFTQNFKRKSITSLFGEAREQTFCEQTGVS